MASQRRISGIQLVAMSRGISLRCGAHTIFRRRHVRHASPRCSGEGLFDLGVVSIIEWWLRGEKTFRVLAACSYLYCLSTLGIATRRKLRYRFCRRIVSSGAPRSKNPTWTLTATFKFENYVQFRANSRRFSLKYLAFVIVQTSMTKHSDYALDRPKYRIGR